MDLIADEQTAIGRQVLLVEDSSATQDLIELVLTSAGHDVQIAGTGQEAIDQLARSDFDVVLCDFHLPDFTGLEVVHRAIKAAGDRKLPRFIAITGDVRGLLSDRANCEVFDRVVPKPLDIDLVCELVEDTAERAGPVAETAPARASRSALDGLGFALMHWPHVSGPAPTPWLDGIDAIVIDVAQDLERLWAFQGAHLMPVLDATGMLGGSADMDVSTLALRDTDRIGSLIELFHDRRAELHADVSRSTQDFDRLLGRIYVAGGELSPRHSNRHDGLVAWNTLADPAGMDPLLTRLEVDGLITTDFFERVHVCPDCRSARVIVREECPACQSANLDEASYLHHFRCAYQGPEDDFRQGDDLICPKCRRELAHFGRDYDRPGNMTRCMACHSATSEPAVAFVCTACARRTDADAMPVRDVVAARLTDAGATYARSGRAYLGTGRSTLRFGDFPLELTLALNRAARLFKEDQTPFTLGYIQYEGLSDLQAAAGARRARDARRLWLETFQQAMDDRVIVTRGAREDFFLMPDTLPDAADAALGVARARADGAVRDNLDCAFRLFGPQDFGQ